MLGYDLGFYGIQNTFQELMNIIRLDIEFWRLGTVEEFGYKEVNPLSISDNNINMFGPGAVFAKGIPKLLDRKRHIAERISYLMG